MRLRIDTNGVQFFCTRAAEQRTVHETGAPRIDKETGAVLWQVQVMALDSAGGEVLAVTVAGEPAVRVGEPITVEGLIAIPWSQGDRSGVAFRATSIRAAGASAAGLGVSSPASTGSPDGTGRPTTPGNKPTP